MTVGEICTRTVATIDPAETIVDAARRMREHHVGDVIAVDAARKPLGILTDRDIVVSAVAQSPDQLDTLRVGDVMTRELVTALTHEDVEAALGRMRKLGVRRLPVVGGDGRLFGIVSLTDVLESVAAGMRQVTGLIGAAGRRERAARP